MQLQLFATHRAQLDSGEVDHSTAVTLDIIIQYYIVSLFTIHWNHHWQELTVCRWKLKFSHPLFTSAGVILHREILGWVLIDRSVCGLSYNILCQMKYDNRALLLFVCITMCFCVFVFVSRVVRENEGNACCHQNQRVPEKERAESGPLMCFQTDTQTDTMTQADRQ